LVKTVKIKIHILEESSDTTGLNSGFQVDGLGSGDKRKGGDQSPGATFPCVIPSAEIMIIQAFFQVSRLTGIESVKLMAKEDIDEIHS
jgi:hypothetical protein